LGGLPLPACLFRPHLAVVAGGSELTTGNAGAGRVGVEEGPALAQR
jgi:hypothetical protein